MASFVVTRIPHDCKLDEILRVLKNVAKIVELEFDTEDELFEKLTVHTSPPISDELEELLEDGVIETAEHTVYVAEIFHQRIRRRRCLHSVR